MAGLFRWWAWVATLASAAVLMAAAYFLGRWLVQKLIERNYDIQVDWGEGATMDDDLGVRR